MALSRVKVPGKIHVRKFVCAEGRIKAEGKAAVPPFCYRLKVTSGKPRKTVIELHSSITGRKIGYIGKGPSKPLASTRSGAQEWVEIARDGIFTPESVEKKMKNFLEVAQDPEFDPKATEQYRKISAEAWKKIVREARKR